MLESSRKVLIEIKPDSIYFIVDCKRTWTWSVLFFLAQERRPGIVRLGGHSDNRKNQAHIVLLAPTPRRSERGEKVQASCDTTSVIAFNSFAIFPDMSNLDRRLKWPARSGVCAGGLLFLPVRITNFFWKTGRSLVTLIAQALFRSNC